MNESRGIKTAVLAIVLSLTVVGLSQCRMADDNITGVGLDLHNSNAINWTVCSSACNGDYKAAERAEDLRYRAAIKSCGKDAACAASATTRSKANHAQNVQNLQDCQRACGGATISSH
jgi:hypothetical protein